MMPGLTGNLRLLSRRNAALRCGLALAWCATLLAQPSVSPPSSQRSAAGNGAAAPVPAAGADDELRLLRARVQAELRNHYLRAADHEREALISGFLADPLAVARRLGLELLQARLTEGASASPAIATRVRELADDETDTVRAAAVVALTALRDPADEAKLLALTRDAGRPLTRLSAVNGLGYIGSDSCLATLLSIADTPDAALRLAAVSALSRLVERGVLRSESLPGLEQKLVALLRNSDAATRERALFSLGRMANAALAPLFEQIAESNRSPTERLAAFRSLSQLGDEWCLPSARRLSQSFEPGLRRAAIEVLKRGGQDATDLALLSRLLACDAEPDEAIRSAAWSGALRLAGELGIETLRELAESLDVNDPDWAERVLELAAAAEAVEIAEDSAALDRIRELARQARGDSADARDDRESPASRNAAMSGERVLRRGWPRR